MSYPTLLLDWIVAGAGFTLGCMVALLIVGLASVSLLAVLVMDRHDKERKDLIEKWEKT